MRHDSGILFAAGRGPGLLTGRRKTLLALPGCNRGEAGVPETCIYFGSDAQRAILRRGRALRDILAPWPRYSYYGRVVGITSLDDETLDDMVALARVQGNSSCTAVPDDAVPQMARTLKEQGLTPLHYAKWEGDGDAARRIIETQALPRDLRLVQVDARTPGSVLESLADMALDCGVLPMCSDVLRGLLQPSVCFVALDGQGRVVSCAASSAYAHREHPLCGDQAWWGMLATAPDRRGEKLALILGAWAMNEMAAKFGYGRFMTGVQPGNGASESVCAKMGLARRGASIVVSADPVSLGPGNLTK